MALGCAESKMPGKIAVKINPHVFLPWHWDS